MTDLVSAIARTSRRLAEPIARSYASGNRSWTVELRRPSGQPTFDREAGAFVGRTAETYYHGPARIYPSSETMREVGDEDVPFNVIQASVDFLTVDNSEHRDWTPRADDLLVILDDEASRDEHLGGRVFEITGVQVAGLIGTGWTLQAVGAAPSRYGDTT